MLPHEGRARRKHTVRCVLRRRSDRRPTRRAQAGSARKRGADLETPRQRLDSQRQVGASPRWAVDPRHEEASEGSLAHNTRSSRRHVAGCDEGGQLMFARSAVRRRVARKQQYDAGARRIGAGEEWLRLVGLTRRGVLAVRMLAALVSAVRRGCVPIAIERRREELAQAHLQSHPVGGHDAAHQYEDENHPERPHAEHHVRKCSGAQVLSTLFSTDGSAGLRIATPVDMNSA
jgi:hypothetical protein